jgi:hypothetical protein
MSKAAYERMLNDKGHKMVHEKFGDGRTNQYENFKKIN